MTAFSVCANSCSKGVSFTGIGVWIVYVRRLPRPRGKIPHLVIFQELLIVKGTTCAEGAYLQRVLRPFSAKGRGVPVLLRVPSGNMTAVRLWVSMYWASCLMAVRDCFGSLRFMRADPPWFRLNEMLGIPLPNSILLMNLGWNFRIKRNMAGIS